MLKILSDNAKKYKYTLYHTYKESTMFTMLVGIALLALGWQHLYEPNNRTELSRLIPHPANSHLACNHLTAPT